MFCDFIFSACFFQPRLVEEDKDGKKEKKEIKKEKRRKCQPKEQQQNNFERSTRSETGGALSSGMIENMEK